MLRKFLILLGCCSFATCVMASVVFAQGTSAVEDQYGGSGASASASASAPSQTSQPDRLVCPRPGFVSACTPFEGNFHTPTFGSEGSHDPLDSDCTVIGSYDEEGRLVGVNEACSASEIARRSSDDSRRTIEAVDGHRNPSSTGFFSRIFGPGGGAALGAATAGVGAPAVASAPATASVTSTAPSGASYVAGSGGAGAGSAGASTDTSDVDAESDVRATEGSKDGDPAGREKDEKDKTVPAPDGGGGNARNGAGAGLQGGSEGAEYLTAIVAMKAGEEIAVRDASSAAVRSSDSERATTPDGGSDGGPALAGGRAPKAASVVDRAGIGGWLALPLVGLSLLAGGAWAWRRQSR